MSNWTEPRLQRLFVRYNRRFWHGRLRGVRVCISPLERCYGQWVYKHREIRIDIDLHKGNDREIRSTPLYEMCHVAAGPGHNSKFWLEIERLLGRRAPINVGFPETDGLQIVENAIPKRFPLARHQLNRVHRQQQRKLEAEARNSGPAPRFRLPFTQSHASNLSPIREARERGWLYHAWIAIRLKTFPSPVSVAPPY